MSKMQETLNAPVEHALSCYYVDSRAVDFESPGLLLATLSQVLASFYDTQRLVQWSLQTT